MSFKDTQSYKELQADWRWIHSMDPEAAAAADQWVKEHPEEWKELEHMLYYSEANFHKRVAPDTLEDVDIKQPLSYNPEAFLPEEVRNAIYNDRRCRTTIHIGQLKKKAMRNMVSWVIVKLPYQTSPKGDHIPHE